MQITSNDNGVSAIEAHHDAGKNFRPRRRADLRTRVVDGETVVLDRREEFVHQFNQTASYIWECCDGLRTPEEIARALCETFAVDVSTARRDVLAVIERLEKAKLLDQ